jgi:hypothetical protein
MLPVPGRWRVRIGKTHENLNLVRMVPGLPTALPGVYIGSIPEPKFSIKAVRRSNVASIPIEAPLSKVRRASRRLQVAEKFCTRRDAGASTIASGVL